MSGLVALGIKSVGETHYKKGINVRTVIYFLTAIVCMYLVFAGVFRKYYAVAIASAISTFVFLYISYVYYYTNEENVVYHDELLIFIQSEEEYEYLIKYCDIVEELCPNVYWAKAKEGDCVVGKS